MAVAASTLLTDTILFVRDLIASNVTDPISAKRPTGERFVMTSYPKRSVTYPIITVQDDGGTTIKPLGMQSTLQSVKIIVQIRIWARNIAERDELFNSVYQQLRSTQYTASTGSRDNNLHDFRFESMVNIDEEGEAGIRSKIIRTRYMFITEGS